MSAETERKFLVHGKPWELYPSVAHYNIKQAYLSKSPATTRIRLREWVRDNGIVDYKAYLTVKSPRIGISCEEFEYEIPYDDGLKIFALCNIEVVEKTRHVFWHAQYQMWEVDEFHGLNEGLILAEIEADNVDDMFSAEPETIETMTLPTWIRKEVSDDPRYTNSYLASHRV